MKSFPKRVSGRQTFFLIHGRRTRAAASRQMTGHEAHRAGPINQGARIMKTYVSWSIHAVFGCVYLSLLGAHLAGWSETRNVVIVIGLSLCGFGLVTCGVLWSLPSLWQPTGRKTWNALSMLGLGLCFLVLATCWPRWIVDNRRAGSSVPSHEWARQQALEQRRSTGLQVMIQRRPAAEVEAARQRSAILKGYVADQAQSLIDSVRSGLDGSKIDALQRKQNDLQAELDSFNPYASAAAFERAKKLEAELARVHAEQEAAIEALQRQAENLVLAAVERGDLGASRQIQDQIARRPRAFSDAQRLAFEQASPVWLDQKREKRCRQPVCPRRAPSFESLVPVEPDL
jgi:hypothetical protein